MITRSMNISRAADKQRFSSISRMNGPVNLILSCAFLSASAAGVYAQSKLPRETDVHTDFQKTTEVFVAVKSARNFDSNPEERNIPGNSESAAAELDDLAARLKPIREQYHLPCLAAIVVSQGKVVAQGVAGTRKAGSDVAARVTDKFHAGSLTKSMTSTLAAMLVEQGIITWRTTLGEVFPDLASRMHPDFRNVTLEQLLIHRGGVPTDLLPDGLWTKLWHHQGAPMEQRLTLLEAVAAKPPVARPGTEFHYSNGGYAIAGAMLEKAAGKPWEALMQEYVFQPLGMESAGFGAPATTGRIDQPWGHRFEDGVPIPVEPGPGADNPSAIAPAGTVHCSLMDMARYVAFHLEAGKQSSGQPKLLTEASLKKLHTPVFPEDEYAFGWVVVDRGWGGGKVLHHTGSNTMNYMNVWAAPLKQFAVIVATNVGGDSAFTATDKVAGLLIKEFPQVAREESPKKRLHPDG